MKSKYFFTKIGVTLFEDSDPFETDNDAKLQIVEPYQKGCLTFPNPLSPQLYPEVVLFGYSGSIEESIKVSGATYEYSGINKFHQEIEDDEISKWSAKPKMSDDLKSKSNSHDEVVLIQNINNSDEFYAVEAPIKEIKYTKRGHTCRYKKANYHY